jgi:hypothetical protein
MNARRISVVLATDQAGPALTKCLDSLLRQSPDPPEILVADTSGEAARLLATKYVEVRFIVADAPLSKPRLLHRTIDQASGSIVAVTEPNCWFPPDWTRKLGQAHDSGFALVGGAVEYGGAETVPGWACFLADYGLFLPPAVRRTSGPLAGNHISYRRDLLSGAIDRQQGYIKTLLLWELERGGVTCLFDPGLVVLCAPDRPPWQFARQYYANARAFAAARSATFSRGQRVAHIAASPAVLFLLLLRRVSAVWPKSRHRMRLFTCLPLMAFFVFCWSTGELVGYLQRRSS